MKASKFDTMTADQVVCPGDGYRLLAPCETVEKGDEVLNQKAPLVLPKQRAGWTDRHGYYGMRAGDCHGTLTGKPRFFRREAQAEKIDVAPKISEFEKK